MALLNLQGLQKPFLLTLPKFFFLYLLSYLLGLYAYYRYIYEIYAYMGFEWNENLVKVIEGFFFTLIITLFLPIRFNKPSDFLIHLQFCFPILPMLILYGATDAPRSFVYSSLGCFFVIIFVSKIVRLKPLRLIKLNYNILIYLLLGLSISGIISILFLGGYKYINFDLLNVYNNRDLAAENLPNLYGYISPLISKVLLPFSMVLSVLKRSYITASVSIIASILMFGLTSHKGPLFYPFMVLAIYLILNKQRPVHLLASGYLFSIALTTLLFYIYAENSLLASLILRRGFFVPAMLNYEYYDFFANNPFTLWSQSKFSLGLFDYPYPVDLSHLIGSYQFNDDNLRANTGWIGSGYANAGYLGMLIYALIIGLTFTCFDAYATVMGKAMVTAISFVPIITLMTSSDLPTAFLNHGILLTMFLFAFFPDKSRIA